MKDDVKRDDDLKELILINQYSLSLNSPQYMNNLLTKKMMNKSKKKQYSLKLQTKQVGNIEEKDDSKIIIEN